MKYAKHFRKLVRFSSLIPQKFPIRTGKLERQPFFIINAGRSGSTVLAGLLDKHSELSLPQDQFALIQAFVKFRLFNWMNWDDLSSLVCSEFIRSKGSQGWNINGRELLDNALKLPKGKRSYEELVELAFRQYINEYAQGAIIWGDKTPINNMYFDLILKMFPEAKYIGLIRDGRDVIASYMKKDKPVSYSYATEKWNRSIEMMDLVQKSIPSNQFMMVRYEQIMSDPNKLDTIQEFIGVGLEDLSPQKGTNYMEKVKVVFNPDHDNVANPITTSSIGKWQKSFTERELQEFLPSISKNLKRFNYL